VGSTDPAVQRQGSPPQRISTGFSGPGLVWAWRALYDPASQERAVAAAESSPLEALVERHRAGDPRALDALLRELYPLVHRAIHRIAGRTDAHDDLVQNALEQVCRSINAFEQRSRVSTFVFAIAYRVVARARRYDRIRSWWRSDAEEATLPQASARPDDEYERARSIAEARRALDRLSVAERAAFVLFELDEVPLDECATVLGCSTRTVKRRLRAARETLRS